MIDCLKSFLFYATQPRRFYRSLRQPHVRLHYFIMDHCEDELKEEMRRDFHAIWPDPFCDAPPRSHGRDGVITQEAYRYCSRIIRIAHVIENGDKKKMYPWRAVSDALYVGSKLGAW